LSGRARRSTERLERSEIVTSLLRSARLEDAAALAEVSVAAWRKAYRGHMPDDFLDLFSIPERTAGWTRRLSRSETDHVLIVESDGRVAGFCGFGPSRDNDSKNQPISEIMALNIHPEHWRCGLGTLLCRHVLQEMSSEGSTAATLWTIEGNIRARRFYERLGFAPDGAARAESKLIGIPLPEVRYRQAIYAL
jgi:RimJ/RimL family protein N-acetyltransferase